MCRTAAAARRGAARHARWEDTTAGRARPPADPAACASFGAWGAGSEIRGRLDARAPRPPSPELSASLRSRPRLTSSWLPGGRGAGGEGAARRGASEAAGPGRGGSASGWAASGSGGSSSPAGVRAASCGAARRLRRRRRLTAGPRPLPSWRARVPEPARARAARRRAGGGGERRGLAGGSERARARQRLGAAAGG